MEDLFSNSPKKDDFEDISSYSSLEDDIEDIFSDTSFSKNNTARSDVRDSDAKNDFDMSYFTYEPEDKSVVNGQGENMRREPTEFEDISSSSKGNKKGSKKKVVITILAVLLVLVIGVGGFAIFKWNDIIDKLNYKPLEDNKYIDDNELMRGDGITNILLIGSDTRVSDMSDSRSDTTILLSLDTKSKQIKLASFLRDSYVEIPEYSSNKLNAAFSWGGTQLLKDTIEYNFKVDIDYYVAIDFEAFKDVVDRLGGVDVEITDAEANYINSQDHMTEVEREAFPEPLEGGMNHFTGAQALWYCRIRYLDSDFQRTERQRKTLNAALQKAKGKSVPELLDLAKYGASLVTTDISKQQINSYSRQALSFMKYEIVGIQIPADGTWDNINTQAGASLGMDIEENTEILRQFIYGGVYEKPTEAQEETE